MLAGLSLVLPPAFAVDKAPGFTLTDVDGEDVSLSDYEGTVVMLDFFHLQCSPCKEMAHDLKRLYDKGYEDFEIISIDVSVTDSDAAIREYADDNDYGWRFAKDSDDLEVTNQYNGLPVPLIVIIDGEGYATFSERGITPYDELKDAVEEALAGEAEAIEIVQVGLILSSIGVSFGCFFSPCAFPLLPGYIAYYFKVGVKKRREGEDDPEPAKPSLGSQVRTGLKLGSISGGGMVLVYLVLGLIVIIPLSAGVEVSGVEVGILEPIIGVILVVLGILTALDVPINTGYVTAPFRRLKERIRPSKGPKMPSYDNSGLFFYGVGYGSASASCSAPLFFSLAIAALTSGSLLVTVVVFVLFLLVLWLLMAVVTVALTVSEEKVKRGLMKYYIYIKKGSGVVFIIVGVALILLYLSGEGIV